jgi:hypothetical protein
VRVSVYNSVDLRPGERSPDVPRCTAFIVLLTISTGLFATASAQTLLTTKNVEVSFQNHLLRGAVLRDQEGTNDDFMRRYYLRNSTSLPAGASLAAYSAQFYGFKVEELSAVDLALEGAGTAASLSLFVGAIGNTLGLWEEDKTWLMVGAMSALGAAWGASKVDDPNWRIRLRWEDLDDMSVPDK